MICVTATVDLCQTAVEELAMVNLYSPPLRNQIDRMPMPSAVRSSLQEIARSIEWSQGDFSLILAHCNSYYLREKAVRELRQLCHVPIREIVLNRSVEFLYATLQEEVKREPTRAVEIWGFEAVPELDRLLMMTNFVFGEFYQNFRFPLVWWVDDATVRKLIRLAPDLYSRTTIVELTANGESAAVA